MYKTLPTNNRTNILHINKKLDHLKLKKGFLRKNDRIFASRVKLMQLSDGK